MWLGGGHSFSKHNSTSRSNTNIATEPTQIHSKKPKHLTSVRYPEIVLCTTHSNVQKPSAKLIQSAQRYTFVFDKPKVQQLHPPSHHCCAKGIRLTPSDIHVNSSQHDSFTLFGSWWKPELLCLQHSVNSSPVTPLTCTHTDTHSSTQYVRNWHHNLNNNYY